MDIEHRRWYITGGTGSLGQHLVPYILDNLKPESVTVLSRNEYEQYKMRQRHPDAKFVICDICDEDAVYRHLSKLHWRDFVVHAAALKHIRTAEEQPEDVIRTNIVGTRNVLTVLDGLERNLVLVSTDKAVRPANVYGWTKHVAEKMVLSAGGKVVRYGNVFGSRGSVLHVFRQAAATGNEFCIHHKDMTRFVITFQQAILTILSALAETWVSDKITGSMNYGGTNGLTVVPELPAMRITDLARAFDDEAVFTEIGVQPGEKIAEELMPGMSSDNARMLSVEEIKSMIGRSL
jgi:UDP-N-acetylglucosamine 4,6-dehydratase